MMDLLQRFLGFDRLLGVGLVKIVYYFGLAGIALGVIVGLLLAIMRLASDLGAGLVQLIAVPAVGAVGLVYWRFLCEIVMVTFQNHDRLTEIRDRLAPPDHPHF